MIAAFDYFARYSGMLSWMRRRCVNGATILMYHKVLPDTLAAAYPSANLVVSTADFNLQMAWLARSYRVLTVRDAISALARDTGRGERPIACVTFDDGYRDNFDYAAPILESHGLRATFFVCTGFIQGTAIWFDRAAVAWRRNAAAAMRRASDAAPERREDFGRVSSIDALFTALKNLSPEVRKTVVEAMDTPALELDDVFGPMRPDHVRALCERGHEIGAHSVTHPFLTSLDNVALEFELRESQSQASAYAGRQVDGFCYPSGDADERVMAAARAAGYQYACAVRRGIAEAGSNRMDLPRRAILSPKSRRFSEAHFEGEVVGWRDLVRGYRKWLSSMGLSLL